MSFFGGQITFAAVLVQLAGAFGIGFVIGAAVILVAIEDQCPAAWEMVKETMGKKKPKEDHTDAGGC